MNAAMFHELTPAQQKLLLDASRAAQERIRQLTEGVDTVEKAKELLEPKGMKVNSADVEAFRKIAQAKVWPAYQKEYPELWEEIVATKV
jgi:TRAP-type C4-dicarboxylate transport system substrate-binding protein